ncbi:ring-cleaving dioxygenase [Nitrolancea hollandica]|uniref:Putative Glyoxalase/bleomycin resistance protein/dioxygenase family protein n=1 Tax=Nitrolancea hollandica Lb TaxID=1129897 RepID=I4EG57_9BACT|nr:ring-cleaving dioxygenase [Nitrolancea hollandica]CCF83669.1 Putative Glyoxalase/bleomycin resistance protein/dioxygenase family protein [Nitrolancea hollandica Lb]
MELGGLHHVSAITGNTPGNVEFYTQVLGLRLVKKTVNQDDTTMYHLFYGDEVGRAGTEMTFFDWPMASPHLAGSGMISATAFRVAGRDSLGWWARRFDEFGVPYREIVERDCRAVLRFTDPEGQHLELVDDTQPGGAPGVAPGVPWGLSPVPVEPAIRGLDGVTLTVRKLEPSATFLEDVLGFRKVGDRTEHGLRAATFGVGPGGPGAEVRLVERPDLPFRRLIGAGGVHHVAFRTPDDEEHAAWQERLARRGVRVTPVIDRFYFRSIYFREPGGILFEIATDGPGFTTDEDQERLGETLALPPFLEPRRAEIEARLRPIAPAGTRSR